MSGLLAAHRFFHGGILVRFVRGLPTSTRMWVASSIAVRLLSRAIAGEHGYWRKAEEGVFVGSPESVVFYRQSLGRYTESAEMPNLRHRASRMVSSRFS